MDSAFWDEIVSLCHALHAHTELSGREMTTKERIRSSLSFHTSAALADSGSWLSARFCPKGVEVAAPIAFHADMDALPIDETIELPYGSVVPDVAHKCSHDGHTAALAAAARLIEQNAAIERPVCLVFQPAEE